MLPGHSRDLAHKLQVGRHTHTHTHTIDNSHPVELCWTTCINNIIHFVRATNVSPSYFLKETQSKIKNQNDCSNSLHVSEQLMHSVDLVHNKQTWTSYLHFVRTLFD